MLSCKQHLKSIVVLLMLVSVINVNAIVVTFDTLRPTSGVDVSGGDTDRSGALTELFLTFPDSDYEVTITRDAGARFDLVNNLHPRQQGKDDFWGSDVGNQYRSVSLDPFADTNGNGFIFTFNMAINIFSVRAGDFGGDTDGVYLLGLTGPGATGSSVNGGIPEMVELVPDSSNNSAWTDARLTLTSDQKFRSVLVLGGTGDMSVFLDRIYFDKLPTNVDGFPAVSVPYDIDDVGNAGDLVTGAVPEPTTFVVFGAVGVLGMMRRRR